MTSNRMSSENGATKSRKKHDPEKLLALFRQSKKTVQKYVDDFQAKTGKKPSSDDLAKAPEYVRVCIKNCKRIKAHLAKQEEQERNNGKPTSSGDGAVTKREDVENVPTAEHQKKAKTPSPKTSESSKPTTTNKKQGTASKVWGAHLNRAFSDITNNASRGGSNSKSNLTRTLSYSGTLAALVKEDLSKNTRKNPKKRSKNFNDSSAWDTLELDDESTVQALIDADATNVTSFDSGITSSGSSPPTSSSTQLPPKAAIVDPLVRFHPELSMDGLSQHGADQEEVDQNDDNELNIGHVGGSVTLKTFSAKTKKDSAAGTSVSFLSAMTNSKVKEAKARERNYIPQDKIDNDQQKLLSFSGLFPKNQQSNDDYSCEPSTENEAVGGEFDDDDIDLDEHIDKAVDEALETATNSKRKSDEELEPSGGSKRPRLSEETSSWSDDDMFADDYDENVDDSNNVKEDELLPYNPNDEEEEDGQDGDGPKRKSKPKKLQGLVSNNFVKINLKKKQFVRGAKNMTGSKHRRMEWKRKMTAKYGKK